MSSFSAWLENHQLPCFYKKISGIDCPGCGMQRSFIRLIEGDFMGSIQLYPALLPLIFVFVFLGMHLGFKFKNGARVLLIGFIFSSTIITVSYIVKASHGWKTNPQQEIKASK